MPKVTEKPNENLECPTPVNAPSATKKSDVQWENGGPNWQVSSFSSCDIGSELGESKGVQDPPGTAAQGFSEALSWEQASQEGSQTSQPCQTAQGLRRQARSTGQRHFKPLGSSVTSEWKPGHL